MSKTVDLKITYGGYAQNGDGAWKEGNSELYAAREGDGAFFFSKLAFSTEGIDIHKSAAISLAMTLCGTSNPYGTSAILTTAELTPAQIHALTTESAVAGVSGYVAYTHCTSHTSSKNAEAGSQIVYEITTEALKSNTTYYLYIRRRVGLPNTNESTPAGWTEMYNPCHSDTYAEYSAVTLTYEPGGYVRIDDGGSIRGYHSHIDDGERIRKYNAYIDTGDAIVKYTG